MAIGDMFQVLANFSAACFDPVFIFYCTISRQGAWRHETISDAALQAIKEQVALNVKDVRVAVHVMTGAMGQRRPSSTPSSAPSHC